MRKNPKRVEQAIKRLNKEIDEIGAAIYASGEERPVLVAAMLERKRDDIVRSAVLQLHTKIEDLLTCDRSNLSRRCSTFAVRTFTRSPCSKSLFRSSPSPIFVCMPSGCSGGLHEYAPGKFEPVPRDRKDWYD
jgi:hypothetical protein